MVRSLISIGTEEPTFPVPEEEDEWVWNEANRDVLLWVNSATGAVKRFNPETQHYDISFNFNHIHTDLENINLTGTVSANGNQGLSGSRVVSGKRLTFTNGLLTGFEDA
uniref:Uncharacterized protein n=1 Tax=viral metagenome TaxID=1070528 RepID=A0A6M3JVB5_9ZZZZ